MPRILISTISIALTILIAIFLLWPKYLKLANLEGQIKAKETELKFKAEYYQELSFLSEKLKREFPEELEKISSALPTNPSPPSLYQFLQKTASENGLILKSIGSFSISPSTALPGIKEITLSSLEFSGSYSSFKNFLSALEKNSRIIEVENISFSAPTEGEMLDFKLTIKTHSY